MRVHEVIEERFSSRNTRSKFHVDVWSVKLFEPQQKSSQEQSCRARQRSSHPTAAAKAGSDHGTLELGVGDHASRAFSEQACDVVITSRPASDCTCSEASDEDESGA